MRVRSVKTWVSGMAMAIVAAGVAVGAMTGMASPAPAQAATGAVCSIASPVLNGDQWSVTATCTNSTWKEAVQAQIWCQNPELVDDGDGTMFQGAYVMEGTTTATCPAGYEWDDYAIAEVPVTKTYAVGDIPAAYGCSATAMWDQEYANPYPIWVSAECTESQSQVVTFRAKGYCEFNNELIYGDWVTPGTRSSAVCAYTNGLGEMHLTDATMEAILLDTSTTAAGAG